MVNLESVTTCHDTDVTHANWLALDAPHRCPACLTYVVWHSLLQREARCCWHGACIFLIGLECLDSTACSIKQ